MLKLQFKITSADRRVYVNDEWISNGHWMIRKRAAMHVPTLKSVMTKWMSVIPGAYEAGEHLGDGAKLPDFDRIIPSMDGYHEAKLSNRVVYSHSSALPTIMSCWLTCEATGAKAAISISYAGLLAIGKPYIKDGLLPVVVKDGADGLAAIIMPRREEW
jgi:hypothetical protein